MRFCFGLFILPFMFFYFMYSVCFSQLCSLFFLGLDFPLWPEISDFFPSKGRPRVPITSVMGGRAIPLDSG